MKLSVLPSFALMSTFCEDFGLSTDESPGWSKPTVPTSTRGFVGLPFWSIWCAVLIVSQIVPGLPQFLTFRLVLGRSDLATIENVCGSAGLVLQGERATRADQHDAGAVMRAVRELADLFSLNLA